MELEALQSMFPDTLRIVSDGSADGAAVSFDLVVPVDLRAPAPVCVERTVGQRSRPPAQTKLKPDSKTAKKRVRARNKHAAKPCRFFNTKRGCRFGDACRFQHIAAPPGAPTAAPQPASAPRPASPPQPKPSAPQSPLPPQSPPPAPTIVLVDTGVTVRHLLPIVLRITFPPAYPSAEPPRFLLDSSWLSEKQRTSLHATLQQVSEDCAGMACVYDCYESLRSAVETLGPVHLRLRGCQRNRRAEAKSSRNANDTTEENREEDAEAAAIDALVRFDRLTEEASFRAATQSCSVCLDNKLGAAFMRGSCGHFFCKDCTTDFVQCHLKDGTVKDLTCPDPSCSRALTRGEIKAAVGEQGAAKFERLLLQKTLDGMND